MNRVVLGDIAEIITGPFGSMLHKSDYVEEGFPLVMPQDIGDRIINFDSIAQISEIDAIRLEKYEAVENDIIYARRGDVETGCLRVRVNPEKANPLFISFYLSRPECREWISKHAVGSNMPNINTEILSDVPIELPDKAQQQKVVDFLSATERKILHNRKINDNLEQMANQLYEYWFIQFQFPNNDNNPYKLSGSPMVYNSLLKIEIPEGWRVKTVASLLDKVPNTLRVQNAEYKSSGNIPIVDQSASLIAGYTDNIDALLSDEHGYIVFGDHTRVVKYIRFPFARGADGTQILKSSLSCMPTELLYNTITHIDLSNQGYARHFKFLKDSLVIVPNDDIAQKFAVQVSIWHEQQKQLLFENMKLSKLRDWLLPMLMNGQATIDD